MESLGELIKRTLKEKGIKESFVAAKMNVSKQVINQIDRRKNFDLAFLIELKDVSGLDFTNYVIPKNSLTSEENPSPATERIVKNKTTTLAMNFEVPSTAYDNLSAFMNAINREADKYGIKVL